MFHHLSGAPVGQNMQELVAACYGQRAHQSQANRTFQEKESTTMVVMSKCSIACV